MFSGCQGGLGEGKSSKGGAGGGGGHGGRGGDGVLSGAKFVGGQTYGNSELPCELGSGGGNPGLGSSTAGGGIIGAYLSNLMWTHLSSYLITLVQV